jgi:hypothetical protein
MIILPKYIILNNRITQIIKVKKCGVKGGNCTCKTQLVYYVAGAYADFPYCFMEDKLQIFKTYKAAETALLLEKL